MQPESAKNRNAEIRLRSSVKRIRISHLGLISLSVGKGPNYRESPYIRLEAPTFCKLEDGSGVRFGFDLEVICNVPHPRYSLPKLVTYM
jgi:hypothetical protein